MGDTASHASLVISQSSVRGLSEAWMALAGLDDVVVMIRDEGAKAAALTAKAAVNERERICMMILFPSSNDCCYNNKSLRVRR
jgi:hypothetical protein